MTARIVAAIASLAVALGSAGCVNFYEIMVETPIQAKLDVSQFQRILVAGFVPGGTQNIDPNTETARLLRSQLRTKSELSVIDADVIPLLEEVDRRRTEAGERLPEPEPNQPRIISEIDFEPYLGIFDDTGYWKNVGAAYDQPLIVTGTVLFTEISRSGLVSRPSSVVNPVSGRQEYTEERQWMEQRGYSLVPTFVFIDGRTGEQLYSEAFQEDVLYPSTQNTPALSAYFELMDKLLPAFLNTLSTQKIRGTRVLVK
jgi:hypothetical protein